MSRQSAATSIECDFVSATCVGHATPLSRYRETARAELDRREGKEDGERRKRVPAGEIETAVIDQLRGLLRAPEIVVRTCRTARQSGEEISVREVAGAARSGVVRNCFRPTARTARSRQCAEGRMTGTDQNGDGEMLIVQIPLRLRKRTGRSL